VYVCVCVCAGVCVLVCWCVCARWCVRVCLLSVVCCLLYVVHSHTTHTYTPLGIPDEQARAHIIRVLSSKMRLEGNVDFKLLARRTAGCVCVCACVLCVLL